jgi:CheY-like chemotaxis protein
MGRVREAFAGKHVLIVEDEFIIALEAEMTLFSLGATVVGPVTAVRDALALIEAADIDAALLDVNLNGETSLPIADVLQAKHIPFVFVSAVLPADLPQEYRGRLVRKPAPIEAIVDTLFGDDRPSL